MSDHEEIWLEPDCCADFAGVGRTWCQDEVYDCEDGVPATRYIRADICDEKLAQVARIRLDLESENRSLKAERAVLRYAIKFTDEDLALARAVVLELAELLKVEK